MDVSVACISLNGENSGKGKDALMKVATKLITAEGDIKFLHAQQEGR